MSEKTGGVEEEVKMRDNTKLGGMASTGYQSMGVCMRGLVLVK